MIRLLVITQLYFLLKVDIIAQDEFNNRFISNDEAEIYECLKCENLADIEDLFVLAWHTKTMRIFPLVRLV